MLSWAIKSPSSLVEKQWQIIERSIAHSIANIESTTAFLLIMQNSFDFATTDQATMHNQLPANLFQPMVQTDTGTWINLDQPVMTLTLARPRDSRIEPTAPDRPASTIVTESSRREKKNYKKYHCFECDSDFTSLRNLK